MNWRVWVMSILRKGNLRKMYKDNLAFQYAHSQQEIDNYVDERARAIYLYHLRNNPGYQQFLVSKGVKLDEAENLAWDRIPLMTKQDLRDADDIVIKSNVYNYTKTGGSTNEPFEYPASKDSALSMWPSHWIVHEQCGVKPYSPILMLMAYNNATKSLAKKIYHWLSNFYTYDSFLMTDSQMVQMCQTIRRKKIQLIYGYSSSINQFLRYLRDTDTHINIKGIVTTSDNRIKENYLLAREYCACDVFDQYGAHDGDIFAFECKCHDGLHILHNKCKIEIIDNAIITTALQNTAMPFIRYVSGDMTHGDLIKTKCACGRTLYRLQGVAGRNTYIFKDLDGRELSVIYFTYPFDSDMDILQYQVVERNDEKLVVNFISNKYTLDDIEKKYRHQVAEVVKRPVEFVLNEEIIRLKNGKVPLFVKQK